MALRGSIDQAEGMLKKIAVGVLIAIGVLIIGVWALTAKLDRDMNSEPLAERLDDLLIPEDHLVLVESWARDGVWGIQNRAPEAGRVYVALGTVAEGCRVLDEFYEEIGITIRQTSRSDDPSDWCGRSVQAPGGWVSVWVEPVRSWTAIPEQLQGNPNLTTIEYRAHR